MRSRFRRPFYRAHSEHVKLILLLTRRVHPSFRALIEEEVKGPFCVQQLCAVTLFSLTVLLATLLICLLVLPVFSSSSSSSRE